MKKPGYFHQGDECKTGGYNWVDHQLYCWRQNWHVPIWTRSQALTPKIINSFKAGVLSYSFLVIKEICSIPVFIFKYREPINFWVTGLNVRHIYPETLFDILKARRGTVTMMLIDKQRVIDTQQIVLNSEILDYFLGSVKYQSDIIFSNKGYLKSLSKVLEKNPRELFIKGRKGHLI